MSPIQIGTAFGPKPPVTPVPPPDDPQPPDEDRLAGLLDAIQRISFPPVVVDPPDLSDIVTAVTSLKPGPTAAEIAAAIADVILPAPAGDDGASLREVAEALRSLDFRLQGMGRQAYGGGQVHLEPGQTIGVSGSVEISNDVGNPIPVTSTGSQTPGDAVINPTDATDTRDFMQIWDTLTSKWVRLNAAQAGIAVGALASAMMLYDGSGGTYERVVPVSAWGDNTSLNRTPAAGVFYYNGSGWDRARGDTANGLDVDVTRVQGNVATLEGTGLVPKVYDYIALGYTGTDLTTVTYKTGGSGGTTVATLTLTYSSSILQTVTRI